LEPPHYLRVVDNKEVITMDENEFEGAARDLGGKVQDAVGGLTGDVETQAQGKWNQAAGKAQKTFGAAADEIRENVADKPLTALAVAAGVFFVLGYLMRK
jgi:uncharacterized protein YjbJ (UPF0337 family)